MLVAAPASTAEAAAQLRFLHAVPGADTAQLSLSARGGAAVRVDARFGQPGVYAAAPSGSTRLTLSLGGRRRATDRARLADGARYTVVALGERSEARLRVFRDGAARARVARLRVIHAAPELGTVDVALGRREAAVDLDFADASGYRTFEPGAYRLTASDAADEEGDLVSRRGFQLTAGAATTAVLVGSGGERLRVVSMTDAAATPAGAPQTGRGGLAGEPGGVPWLLVLGGAIAAGLLGAAAYAVAGGRARGPGGGR